MAVKRCDICGRKVCLGNCPNFGIPKTVEKVEVKKPKAKPKAKPKKKEEKK